MSPLSQMIDALIERAHSSSMDEISDIHCSDVLGLGTRQDQVCHDESAHSDTTPVNRVLDSALGALSGDYLHEAAFARPQQQALFLLHLIPLILNWIKQQGGLPAAVRALQNVGLQAQVASWVASGINARIMPEQLDHLFQQDQLEQLAQQYRIDVDTVRTGIATLLPQMIDYLTTDQYAEGLHSADVEINNMLNRLVNI